MNTPLTCTEPLVWTCKACGHSFHAEEWQSHGRQCPACTEKRGEWKCSLCLGSFTQPALQGPHPCKKGAAENGLTSSPAPSMPRTITLPGWLSLKNAVFLLGGLVILGLAYLLISIRITQNRQEKSQQLSALFAGAQQSSASGNYDKAISLYREMEDLSAAMPDWSFSAKNGLSRALVKANRTEEARLKLGEAEMILKNNPKILKGQDLQGAIDFTRREIQTSEISPSNRPQIVGSDNVGTTSTSTKQAAVSQSPHNNETSQPASGIFSPLVQWRINGSVVPSSVFSLELNFKNCQPNSFVVLPEISGIQFLGQPGRSTSFEMIEFKTISTTTLTYSVLFQARDKVTVPAFEIDTDKGKLMVASISLIPSQSFSASEPPNYPTSNRPNTDSPDLPQDYSSLKQSLRTESEGILPPDYSRSGQETDWDRECQGGWWPSGTEVGRYKLAFYQKVGRIWDDVAMIYGPRLQAGRLVIKFRIQPDGSVADLRVTQGDATSTLAQVVRPILAKAVGQSGSFSRTLKKESPDGFEWQLAFRVDN